jgi:two-component system probable response regulator PhcQ
MKNSILIVDDEPNVVFAFQRTLLDEPYDIRFAFDGGKALRILDRDPVKVIISDERMPRLSGIELLSIAKKRHPGVVRIMITGVAEMGTAMKAVNLAEVYRFFVKPWNDAELIAALRAAINKHDLDAGKHRLPKMAAIKKAGLERMKRRYAEIAEFDWNEQDNMPAPEFSDEEIAVLLGRLEIKMS